MTATFCHKGSIDEFKNRENSVIRTEHIVGISEFEPLLSRKSNSTVNIWMEEKKSSINAQIVKMEKSAKENMAGNVTSSNFSRSTDQDCNMYKTSGLIPLGKRKSNSSSDTSDVNSKVSQGILEVSSLMTLAELSLIKKSKLAEEESNKRTNHSSQTVSIFNQLCSPEMEQFVQKELNTRCVGTRKKIRSSAQNKVNTSPHKVQTYKKWKIQRSFLSSRKFKKRKPVHQKVEKEEIPVISYDKSEKKGYRLVEDLLIPALDNKTYGDKLKWANEKGVFLVNWTHKARTCWGSNDSLIYTTWDTMKGRPLPETDEDFVNSKQRFRAALHQIKTIEEIGKSADYRKYRITNLDPLRSRQSPSFTLSHHINQVRPAKVFKRDSSSVSEDDDEYIDSSEETRSLNTSSTYDGDRDVKDNEYEESQNNKHKRNRVKPKRYIEDSEKEFQKKSRRPRLPAKRGSYSAMASKKLKSAKENKAKLYLVRSEPCGVEESTQPKWGEEQEPRLLDKWKARIERKTKASLKTNIEEELKAIRYKRVQDVESETEEEEDEDEEEVDSDHSDASFKPRREKLGDVNGTQRASYAVDVRGERKGSRLIEDFLYPALQNKTYGDLLKWDEDDPSVFCICWTHKSKSSWGSNDCIVFKAWDELKGRPFAKTHKEYVDSKQRLRAALRNSKKIEEVDGNSSYRKYRITHMDMDWEETSVKSAASEAELVSPALSEDGEEPRTDSDASSRPSSSRRKIRKPQKLEVTGKNGKDLNRSSPTIIAVVNSNGPASSHMLHLKKHDRQTQNGYSVNGAEKSSAD